MDNKRLIKILLFSIILIGIFLPIKSLAASSAAVEITPEWGSYTEFYARENKTTFFKFDLCGDPELTNLKPQLSEEGGSGVLWEGSMENYSEPRSETGGGIPCNTDSSKQFYGKQQVAVDVPFGDVGDVEMIVKYFAEGGGEGPAISRTFTVHVVTREDLPDKFSNYEAPGLLEFSKRIKWTDIFGSRLDNPQAGTPKALAQAILNILLLLVGLIGLLAFIWSGYTLLTSAGEPSKVEKGKKGLLYAATGVLLVIFAQYIISAVNIFESPPDDDDIPTVPY